jgi:hypothetical protein
VAQGLCPATITAGHDAEGLSHLKKPRRLSISKRPHGKPQAISWFKDTAIDHVAKMREVTSILQAHDVGVEMIKSQRPGYIVYEDQFQIAAYPFSDTNT